MKILQFPHESLFTPADDVTVFEMELKVLLDNMWNTMLNARGIGLAANQVGLRFNMFVMKTEANEKLYLVNPKVVKKSIVITLLKEGCLSAPGEQIVTGNRSEWISVDYQDYNGNKKNRMFTGIDAVCVQHEMEHLAGLSFMESKSISKKVRKELANRWGFTIK